MSISVNIHKTQTMVAQQSGPVAWVEITSNDGAKLGVFMPYSVAQAVAQSFTDAMAEHAEGKLTLADFVEAEK